MIIYAVDDETLMLNALCKAITAVVPDAQLHAYLRSSLLLADMEKDISPPDYAFLDIEMPGIGGLELAKRIKIAYPKTRIVFVTGFSQYALEAYEIHASGYVMKPITVERIRRELELPLEIPVLAPTCRVRVRTFGNFEVFVDGTPVKFKHSRSRELFAYLIDRQGASLTTAEISAVLWEDGGASSSQKSQFRKYVSDISNTFSLLKLGNVFIKSRDSFAVNVNEVDCDLFRFLHNDPNAISCYLGEYMSQYSWAEVTIGWLEQR